MAGTLGLRALRFLLIVAAGILILYIASRFTEVTIAAIIAGILYYLSLPIVTFLDKHRFPRALSVLLTLLVFATLILLLLAYTIPIVVEQLTALALEVPTIVEQVESWLDRLRGGLGGTVSERRVQSIIDQISATAGESVAAFAAGIVTRLANIVSVLLGVVAGVVAAFYLLLDHENVSSYARIYAPVGSEGVVDRLLTGINRVLSGFLRGQVIVALIVGTLVGVALLILGVPYAFLLAVIAAVFELVPYLGPILAAIPAVLLALSESPGTALLVGGAFFVIQQVESLVLSPKIVGAQIRLHPVTIIFSVLIGSQILGVLGIFLAVPIAGVVKVFVEELLLSPRERQEAKEADSE